MIDLSPADERTYDRLYRDRPHTRAGRVRRAILLVRKGWCDSRAFEDCFEIGDGGHVLDDLLRHIATKEPELRTLMRDQGSWCPENDRRLTRQGELFGEHAFPESGANKLIFEPYLCRIDC